MNSLTETKMKDIDLKIEKVESENMTTDNMTTTNLTEANLSMHDEENPRMPYGCSDHSIDLCSNQTTKLSSPLELWTTRHEKVFQRYMIMCEERAKVHLDESIRLSGKAKLVGYPLSLITGIMSPVNLIMGTNESSMYVNVCAYFVIGGLSALLTTWDANNKAKSHHYAYTDYNKLFNKINIQLKKDIEHRTNVTVFTTEVRITFENLVQTSPSIKASQLSHFYPKWTES